jgi:hypothetical protein
MQAFGHAISSVSLSLLSPSFQLAAGLKMQAQDSSTHPQASHAPISDRNTYVL